LEWELQLISKDNEARKLILEIISQKNEIENTARQKERPEEFLKDLKDLTTSSNPFSQHFESEREKKRQKKKIEKLEKKEKYYKEDLKKWERHEEERERELVKEIQEQEELTKRKKKLLERDLNYDSEEEKKKLKLNPKKYEEHRLMREKEKEMDEIMRISEKQASKKDEPEYNINEDVKDVAIYGQDDRVNLITREPEAKATVTIQEYQEEYESEEENSNTTRKNIMGLYLNLNIETKKLIPKIIDHYDYDNEDPIHNKEKITHLEFNPETEKEILEMKREVLFDKKEEKKQPEVIPFVVNASLPGNPQKIIEIQKQIFEMIPKSKEDLFKFSIDWSVVYKYNILENKIKPWLGKKLKEYIGEDEPNLIAMIIKKLGNKASPYEIMEKIKVVFDEDTEVYFYIIYLTIYVGFHDKTMEKLRVRGVEGKKDL
jgi:RNA-binding protein 25